MLSLGIVEPILSEWQSAVVIVPKDGDDLRLCVDFRDVNAITSTINYPLPNIEDIVLSLGGSCYYVKLDLASGFW